MLPSSFVRPGVPQPALRPLKIFPTDPIQGYARARRAVIQIENEPLKPGPVGDRLEIIDYDSQAGIFYPHVNLDEPAILMQGGLEPTEGDPRFHQQMVYAVASRTLANFDRALGRRINMRRGPDHPRLRLFPHAFHGQNAFYDRALHAVLFGYFRADRENPGPNMPEQMIFTCLSHDIIAHEVTHAVVDQLNPYYLEPSNPDVLAFHEGFADIVALLQHFTFHDLLAEEIQRRQGDLRKPTVLVEIAQQFGYAIGTGKALRSALDRPEARLHDGITEPHERGSILVAAVFDGFLTTYQARIQDLIRIATGGTGTLPPGDLLPDLVNRIASEAAHAAQRQLEMCIRAFVYLPPVNLTFGDYLRALVTADLELNPDDEGGQRTALIEGFRQRGIYPPGVRSLTEESLRRRVLPEDAFIASFRDPSNKLLPRLLHLEAQRFAKLSSDPVRRKKQSKRRPQMEDTDDRDAQRPFGKGTFGEMRRALLRYAKQNALDLGLEPGLDIDVANFNTVFRTAPNGGLLIELVAQFIQTDKETESDPDWGGVPVRGGATIIIGVDGEVRYVISKSGPTHIPSNASEIEARLRRKSQNRRRKPRRDYVAELDARDPAMPYMDSNSYRERMRARMSIRALHETK